MKKSTILTVILALMAMAGVGVQQTWAQAEKPFPTRQVNYMVCFDPGGQSDRAARVQQPLLEKILKQKVIVDYKIGGGGALGWRELSRARPDGYTIAGFNVPHIILQPLQQEVGLQDRADHSRGHLSENAAGTDRIENQSV